jgi:DNA-binding NarL/FixJ family response regulator
MTMQKALIVEDNLPFRRLLREALHARFPAVAIAEAGDGSNALEQFACLNPDVVLMDIRLPGSNGLQLTRTIKQSAPSTKVIILTAHDGREYREMAKAVGADHFFAKEEVGGEGFLAVLHSMFDH